MEELLRLKNCIETAQNIGILAKLNADNDAIGTTLALFFALKNANKNVFFAGQEIPEKLPELLKGKEHKKLHISFKDDVSEVYYEKKENSIDLYLTPKNENITGESFSYKIISGSDSISTGSNYDVLITIGIEEFQEVESLCNDNLDQLYGCDIVNIDTNLSNQNYGEINIVQDGQSLSQLVSCILKYLGKDYLNKEISSFLLFSLASSDKNVRNKKNIPTIKWLLNHGGEFNFLPENKAKTKLLEKALENMQIDEESSTYISTLSENNMIENGATSKDLAYVIEKIKMFFKIPSFLVLWESRTSPLSVKGVVYSDRKIMVQKIMQKYKGISKGNGAIFITDVSSIIEAKEKILPLLK